MEIIFVLQQVLILAVLMLVGYCSAKKNIINEETSQGMTQILINIALPALILSSLNFSYSSATIKWLTFMFIYSLSIHIFNIVIAKIMFRAFNKEVGSILEFGTVFANSGFMGLPLIFEFYGEKGVFYASMFMVPYYILLWTYGQNIISGESKKFSIVKAINNPVSIAIIIGMLIFMLKINLPYIVFKPLRMLASLTTPLSMLIIGEKMAKLKLKDIILDKKIYYGCFVRLILLPIITYILLTAISTPELLMEIVVIMQSLPTAILLIVFTQKYDGNVDLALKFTIISHILSIITIPIILATTGMLR
ncbi:Auxin Efflux Carrier [[Clostridium] ultunense Esp]|nr:Auxin Efflux Carrier [[Clostridium] ultunense Esp]